MSARLAALLALLLAACASPSTAQDSPAPKRKEQPDSTRRPLDGPQLRAAAFAPQLLRERRKALLAKLPEDAVVVLVAPRHSAGDLFSYRPSPDFLYLSGQGQPRLVMLLARDEDVLFAPPQDKRWELWNGPRLAVGNDLAAASGFGDVVPRSKRKERVAAALERRGGQLYLLGAEPKDFDLPKDTKFKSPASALHSLRQVKVEAELALLRRACKITAASLTETIRSIQPGQFEYEVEAVIEYMFRRYGAQRPGFASIVGAGPNTCVLHYSSNSRRFKAGELIVMDVGAEYHGYTADVTRTVPISGRFTKRQREVYELVLKAQAAGIAACRPGATVAEVDRAARKVIKDAGYGRYFLHGTSHWLGMDVHDVGAYSRPLKPGMVLTVEPGIYIKDEALGIRIEDDILVTAEGPVVLSAGVPRDPDAIEALMKGSGVGKARVAPLPSKGGKGKGKRKFFRLR